MNSRYAFMTKSANIRQVGDAYYFDPGLTDNRPPYEIVELIQSSIVLDTEKNQVVVKTDLQPSNYYSNDHMCIATGILHFASTKGTDYRYEISDSEKPKYIVSNLRPFRIFLFDLDGVAIADADVKEFYFMFKITYPEQGSITRDYVKSIPEHL